MDHPPAGAADRRVRGLAASGGVALAAAGRNGERRSGKAQYETAVSQDPAPVLKKDDLPGFFFQTPAATSGIFATTMLQENSINIPFELNSLI